MPLILGAFNRSGSATLKIRVAGTTPAQEYDAVIDTGFNGFLAMPIMAMVDLGLRSEGAVTVTLGDGSKVDNLVARGSITIGSRTEICDILLDENSPEVLLGLSLLRAFSLALIITDTVVLLYDEKETLGTVAAFMNTLPQGLPNTSSSSIST
jgi:predicted aspartyl protease